MGKIKLIYNPHAGSKKHLFSHDAPALLQDIYALLYKYEIEFDESSTQAPEDARRLAREAAREGYEKVIVAGGDGTVGEVANGLVGTDTALGILPLGTYMNVARMLSIPFNLENAVMIIKIGNVRSIDVGEIVSLEEEEIEGKPTSQPNYFLESAGIGLEADWQKNFLSLEKIGWRGLGKIIKDLREFYHIPLTVELDENRTFESLAHLILISNGPYMGAGLPVAPSAKLNDHLLTIRRYRMSKLNLLGHLLRVKIGGKNPNPEILTYTSTFIRVTSPEKRPVDADARVFGQTPVLIKIKPHALKAIVGFPNSKLDAALLQKKIFLNP